MGEFSCWFSLDLNPISNWKNIHRIKSGSCTYNDIPLASSKRRGLPKKLFWVVDNIKSNDLYFFVLVPLDRHVGF